MSTPTRCCTGDCRQGRECPARMVQQYANFVFFVAVLCLAAVVTITMAIIFAATWRFP